MSRASKRRAKRERKLARQRHRESESTTTRDAIVKAAQKVIKRGLRAYSRDTVPLHTIVPDDENVRLSRGMT